MVAPGGFRLHAGWQGRSADSASPDASAAGMADFRRSLDEFRIVPTPLSCGLLLATRPPRAAPKRCGGRRVRLTLR